MRDMCGAMLKGMIADGCLCYLIPNMRCTLQLRLSRSPDDSTIRQKMLFASSKDVLRRSLADIATEIQGAEVSDITYESGTSAAHRLAIENVTHRRCLFYLSVLDKLSRRGH